MDIEGMEGVDGLMRRKARILCPPNNFRHKFTASGKCVRCGADQNAKSDSYSEFLKTLPPDPTPPPLKGPTHFKVKQLTQKMAAYELARAELVQILGQLKREKLEFTDPLKGLSREALDLLYRELGQEIFWGKQHEGISNPKGHSDRVDQEGPPFIPDQFGDGVDGGSDPSPF